MNIYQKMAAVTADLAAVPKNLNVGVGKSSYKAVGEADVLAAVKPLEAKHGIYSYPFSREIVDASTVTTQGNYGERTNYRMRLKVVYRFVNIEEPTEFVEVTSFGDGIDPGDKAPGKAMTYADKYALLKAYKCVTGDDPDQYESPYIGSGKPAECKCEKCGRPIRGYTDRNGGYHSDSEVVAAARKKFGKALCLECYKIEKEGK